MPVIFPFGPRFHFFEKRIEACFFRRTQIKISAFFDSSLQFTEVDLSFIFSLKLSESTFWPLLAGNLRTENWKYVPQKCIFGI